MIITINLRKLEPVKTFTKVYFLPVLIGINPDENANIETATISTVLIR